MDLSVLHALGVGSTGRGLAGIRSGDTPLTLTHVPLLAVWVSDALGPTASDGVRLGNQTRLASANWVT